MTKAKILLVDDDEDLRRALGVMLEGDGYEVMHAANGVEALSLFERASLVVLDIMLPEIDGFEVCRRIRERSDVPIIMLTAKGDIVDKRVGFNMGTDDYLVKPFSSLELSLRIEAVLRRAHSERQSEESEKNRLEFGRLVLDREKRQALVEGEDASLTATEFDLLWMMALYPERVFTRKQLFDGLWGEDTAGEPKTITVLMRRIREKVERDPGHPEYVITVWGVGYKFSRPNQSA